MKKPKHCKGCLAHWNKGIKDGKHDNWCCHFGKPAPKAVKRCILINAKGTMQYLRTD